MGRVDNLSVICFRIIVIVTLRTTLNCGCRDLKVRALVFLVANRAGNARFLMGLSIRGVKFIGRVTFDTGIFYRLIQGVTGRAGIAIGCHRDSAALYF